MTKAEKKVFNEMVAYVRTWAETTTEEECPTDQGMEGVDRSIIRARRLLKKHKIEFFDPKDD